MALLNINVEIVVIVKKKKKKKLQTQNESLLTECRQNARCVYEKR